ncbi:HemY protein [Hasllibacter halocynthiae]|uniref:HemY protein n=1 Tax=Hasllibacter halocynthiae TaxID=595589 RepID=A0A2T0X2R3_9RHOB|nr:heme biosynthesis HemY N-terminal domain-containing protein [Hasllibacter halocynthiae]PRY93185.1 HemY protein [Hasllibacter halocynthiae]
MLWSLVKILLFIGVVLLLTYAAGWLTQAEGGMIVAFAGYEVALGPLQAAIALLLLALALWLIFKLVGLLAATVRFLNGDDTAISRYFDGNRQKRGLDAAEATLMAMASGEGRQAVASAQKAERLLNRPALTGLLTAQAAEVAGDRRRAEDAYRRLIEMDRTRFAGVRGVMRQRLLEGDVATARKLADRAFEMRPRNEEVQDTLLKLQTAEGDWAGARQTLAAKLRAGNMPRDLHTRRDAVLALADVRGVLEGGIGEREAAIEANRLSPDLVPAAAAAARAYIADGKPKYAVRVLRRAWEAQPHPDLAAAFAEIAPDESPQERIKRFRVLTAARPEHPETRMLLAELYLAAEDFPAARRALGDLPTTGPTARSLTLMAAIERGEGASDAVVRAWLARAVTASRGPQWVCDVCHTIHAEWQPVCENCGAFDSLAWTVPPQAEMTLPGGAGMLPLLVGAPEDAPMGETGETDALIRGPEVVETADDAGMPPPGGPGAAPAEEVGDPPPQEPANPAPGETRTG